MRVQRNLLESAGDRACPLEIADEDARDATRIAGRRYAHVVADFHVETSTPDRILELECDVLAPCALGAVVNAETIPRMKCRVVCGSANNQLAGLEDADELARAGILYAPDFIVNAGGLISVADEMAGWNEMRVLARVEKIGRTLLDVFHHAQVKNVSTASAAVDYAKRRIREIGSLTR